MQRFRFLHLLAHEFSLHVKAFIMYFSLACFVDCLAHDGFSIMKYILFGTECIDLQPI